MNVYVTGIGIISAIGYDVCESLNNLLKAKTGISPIELVNSRHKDNFLAGEVKLNNNQLGARAKLPDADLTRTTLLGYLAAKEALENAGIVDTGKVKVGLISASTVGGTCNAEKYYGNFLLGGNKVNFIDSYDRADSTEFIASTLGINGFLTTINTACASSANAITLGTRMIKNKKLDRVIVGGTDALSRFTVNGFNALKLLDNQLCKPFDKFRQGINLGEGAAYLVLESEALVRRQNKVPLAKISGYGVTNDAYHATASSPGGDGIYRAIMEALSTSQINAERIDYINAHGTGTANNDITEGLAIKKAFLNQVPSFSSTKSFTGHALGAAGAIEAVISILCLQHNFIPPNLNFSEHIEEHSLSPVVSLQENVPVRNVLSNSVGMGGSCCSIIFSKN